MPVAIWLKLLLVQWLKRVGRPVVALPPFFLQALPVSSAVSALQPSTSLSLPSSLSPILLIGPAGHCGRSRLFPSHHTFTYLGPACHCGRSRLTTSPSLPISSHSPILLLLFHFIHTHLPYPHPPYWPGLSLWQVPPHFPHLPPSSRLLF